MADAGKRPAQGPADQDNNFNLLRLIAATAVIFSHATDITVGQHDLLADLFGYSGGWIAVSAFFTMSGYLIYGSGVRSSSVVSYMTARCLRILPGLWVMLLVVTLLLGLAVTRLPALEYLSSIATLEYVLGNGILYFPRYFLPGVFEGNALSGVVNGSLWTLRFEFTCYLLVLVLMISGVLRNEKRFRLVVGVALVAYAIYIAEGAYAGTLAKILFDGSTLAKMHRLSFAFLVGMLYARYCGPCFPRLGAVAGCAVLSLLLWKTPLFATALVLLIAAVVFWVAFAEIRAIQWAKTAPDISYGIYIYAFPIQQAITAIYPDWSPLQNALVSTVLTALPATLSWYLIEKPSLSLKNRFARRKIAL